MTRNRGPRIHVTDDDIATAIPKDSGHCAIADAIRRQWPDVRNVSVDLATIRWTDRAKGERYVYLTPQPAQQLLLAFDQGWRDRLVALSFRLEPPVQVSPVKAATRAQAARTGRPTRMGPATAERVGRGRRADGDPTGDVVKRGGHLPPIAVLSHGRGVQRQYGVRHAGQTG